MKETPSNASLDTSLEAAPSANADGGLIIASPTEDSDLKIYKDPTYSHCNGTIDNCNASNIHSNHITCNRNGKVVDKLDNDGTTSNLSNNLNGKHPCPGTRECSSKIRLKRNNLMNCGNSSPNCDNSVTSNDYFDSAYSPSVAINSSKETNVNCTEYLKLSTRLSEIKANSPELVCLSSSNPSSASNTPLFSDSPSDSSDSIVKISDAVDALLSSDKGCKKSPNFSEMLAPLLSRKEDSFSINNNESVPNTKDLVKLKKDFSDANCSEELQKRLGCNLLLECSTSLESQSSQPTNLINKKISLINYSQVHSDGQLCRDSNAVLDHRLQQCSNKESNSSTMISNPPIINSVSLPHNIIQNDSQNRNKTSKLKEGSSTRFSEREWKTSSKDFIQSNLTTELGKFLLI